MDWRQLARLETAVDGRIVLSLFKTSVHEARMRGYVLRRMARIPLLLCELASTRRQLQRAETSRIIDGLTQAAGRRSRARIIRTCLSHGRVIDPRSTIESSPYG